NQLVHWAKVGYLHGAPDPARAPRSAVWNDPASGTLGQRARAWLEINCAHCHNPDGPARTSGLDLRAAQTDPYQWGVHKTPVAAGRGPGGGAYRIVPGRPGGSIPLDRLPSAHPGLLVPGLAPRLVRA